MKKWICFFSLLLLSGLLCGCAQTAGGENYARFDAPFELTADFTRGALSGSFLFSHTSPEQCALSYLAPQTLCGMRVSDEAGVVTTELDGMRHEQSRAALRDGNPMRALCRALEAFRAEQPPGRPLDNGETEYTLSYGARLVSGSGMLRRVESPADELVITVTGFEFL